MQMYFPIQSFYTLLLKYIFVIFVENILGILKNNKGGKSVSTKAGRSVSFLSTYEINNHKMNSTYIFNRAGIESLVQARAFPCN